MSLPVQISIFIAVAIVVTGSFFAYKYIAFTYKPGLISKEATESLQKIYAEQTASMEATLQAYQNTQEYQSQLATRAAQELQATESAISQQKTKSALDELSTQSALATIQAIPTPTPQLMDCAATVNSDSGILSILPSYIETGIKTIPQNTTVVVNGRLRDNAWVHVVANGETGFMRRSNLKYSDDNCSPMITDIHFFTSLFDSRNRVLVDETFASDQYSWVIRGDKKQNLLSDKDSDEAYLELYSKYATKVISTNTLKKGQFPAFQLITYFKLLNIYDKGYFGIRFADNKNSYYEFRFFPTSCEYSIIDGIDESTIKLGNLRSRTCSGDYTYLVVNITKDNNLLLTINGENVGPIPLEISHDRNNGGIDIIVSNLDLDINFIIVSTPK